MSDTSTTAPRSEGPERELAAAVGPAADRDLLVGALCRICALGGSDAAPRTALLEAARAAAHALPDARGVSLALGSPDQPIAVVPTDPVASSLDGVQLQAGEGPAFEAWQEQRTQLSDDLGGDPRWPLLARLAAGDPTAPRAVAAVPVSDPAGRIGVLTCYLPHPPAAREVHDLEALAAAAAGLVRVLNLREELRTVGDQLQQALASRAVIDQAKGIVMADRHCSPDEAFAHLAALSQHRNVKLREIAGEIVARTTTAPGRAQHEAGRTDP